MNRESPAAVAASWVGFIVLTILIRVYPWWALAVGSVIACGTLIAWAVATVWAAGVEEDRTAALAERTEGAEWFALADGRIVDAEGHEL